MTVLIIHECVMFQTDMEIESKKESFEFTFGYLEPRLTHLILFIPEKKTVRSELLVITDCQWGDEPLYFNFLV